MASVTGSRLAFFGKGVNANKINVVLTADGSDVAGKAIAGDLNIEVFTSVAGSLASGFQASAFIQGAQLLGSAPTNAVQAGSPTSTEEILASVPDSGTSGSGFTGNLVLDDFSGGATRGETISIVGSSGQTYSVFGSQGDTISGSSNSAVSNYIDASGTLTPKNPPPNGGPFPGAETVTGGAGSTTVRGGTGDVITGGAGSLLVTDEHHDGNQTVRGGTGSLKIFQIGQNFSITGSTGGTTIIDDDYGNGGGSSIVGGSGTGLIEDPRSSIFDSDFKGLSGENTYIVAASTDQVTIGSALTYLNASKGNVTIQGGDGTTNGTVEGAAGYNSNILAGKGDVITLGAAKTYVDATAGSVSITGGSGFAHIEAGKSDVITGGSGELDINNIGNKDSITGGSGNLFSFGKGTGETITGSTKGWTLIDSGGNSSIAGGTGTTAGTVTGAGGIFDNTIINAGSGDTVKARGASTTYVNAFAGNVTVDGGSGATTVLSGKGDLVTGAGGTIEVDTDSDQNGKATTIDLGKGSGAATLRDISVTGGKGATDSVTGFNTSTDTIASKTSVSSTGTFLGTSKSDGAGGTILTFLDGTQMTLAGIADVTKVKFTQ